MRLIALLSFVLVMTPALGAAQDAPPAGPPPGAPGSAGTPSPEFMSVMRQAREQTSAMHRQARLQMLGSISAQHRSQLATLVGQYAVSANPDREALAKQIDTLLSRNEAQSVVNVAASERTSGRAMMEAVHQRIEATLPAEQRSAMDAREQKMAAERASRTMPAPDPGRELLRALGVAGEGHEGGMRGMGMEERPHQ